MVYTKLDLRNNKFALLRRLERKKNAEKIHKEIVKERFKPSREKRSFFVAEFEKEKEHFTRLGLYDKRGGRSF